MQWDKEQEEEPEEEQGEELKMTSPGTCAFDHRCSDARVIRICYTKLTIYLLPLPAHST